MSDWGCVVRIRGVHWLMAVTVLAVLLAGGVPASASSGTTIGPVQINPVGHPHLCWQATGNGAPVLLEKCDPAIEAQQWSLTPDGVLMNGIGYCLEARAGQPAGVPLFIDFASQCGGSRGQVWQYNGTTGHLSSLGTCAGLAGRVAAGSSVVRRDCPGGPRWSIGYSAVTLRPGSGSGAAGGTFDTSVTVTNATSAQTAYQVTVEFGPPRGLDYTAVRATGGASGWHCDRSALAIAAARPPTRPACDRAAAPAPPANAPSRRGPPWSGCRPADSGCRSTYCACRSGSSVRPASAISAATWSAGSWPSSAARSAGENSARRWSWCSLQRVR